MSAVATGGDRLLVAWTRRGLHFSLPAPSAVQSITIDRRGNPIGDPVLLATAKGEDFVEPPAAATSAVWTGKSFLVILQDGRFAQLRSDGSLIEPPAHVFDPSGTFAWRPDAHNGRIVLVYVRRGDAIAGDRIVVRSVYDPPARRRAASPTNPPHTAASREGRSLERDARDVGVPHPISPNRPLW